MPRFSYQLCLPGAGALHNMNASYYSNGAGVGGWYNIDCV